MSTEAIRAVNTSDCYIATNDLCISDIGSHICTLAKYPTLGVCSDTPDINKPNLKMEVDKCLCTKLLWN